MAKKMPTVGDFISDSDTAIMSLMDQDLAGAAGKACVAATRTTTLQIAGVAAIIALLVGGLIGYSLKR